MIVDPIFQMNETIHSLHENILVYFLPCNVISRELFLRIKPLTEVFSSDLILRQKRRLEIRCKD